MNITECNTLLSYHIIQIDTIEFTRSKMIQIYLWQEYKRRKTTYPPLVVR